MPVDYGGVLAAKTSDSPVKPYLADPSDASDLSDVNAERPPGTVWLWPVEYNAYGPGNTRIIVRPDGSKDYPIVDHLGSVRLLLGDDGVIKEQRSYGPFGEDLISDGDGARTSYIGRENDHESNLGFFGVRHYDPTYGRFMSVDPLWAKYAAYSSYQYALNLPVFYKDPSGETVVVEDPATGDVYTFDGHDLIAEDGTKYEGDNEFLVSTRQHLVYQISLGGDALENMLTLMNLPLLTTFSQGRFGDGSETRADGYEGPDAGLELATALGVGVPSRVLIDPMSPRTKSDCDLAEEYAHEIGHEVAYVTGTRSYDSEWQGLAAENYVRMQHNKGMRVNWGPTSFPVRSVLPRTVSGVGK